jgi:flagellar biosynthesis/type III secretory pathway protein FliH
MGNNIEDQRISKRAGNHVDTKIGPPSLGIAGCKTIMALSFGRVVRVADDSAIEVFPGEETVSNARVVGTKEVEASAQASVIIEKARLEAQAILHEAAHKAKEQEQDLREQARAQAAAEVLQAWQTIQQAKQQDLEQQQEEIITVARLLAERLLNHSLELHPETIVDLAKQALSVMQRAKNIRLYANERDTHFLRQNVDQLGFDSHAIEIRVDEDQPPGHLRAETSLGTIDASITSQLDRLVAAIRSGS